MSDSDKAKMLLSRETIEGLHVTGIAKLFATFSYIINFHCLVKSFVELSKYLLTQPFMKDRYLLSEHFSQDPIENYFGKLRYHGGWCQNPTVSACITAAQSLRVQSSMAMIPVRGNSRRKRRVLKDVDNDVIDNTPLQKKKRKKLAIANS